MLMFWICQRSLILSSTFNVADLKRYYPPEPDPKDHSGTNAAEEKLPDVGFSTWEMTITIAL